MNLEEKRQYAFDYFMEADKEEIERFAFRIAEKLDVTDVWEEVLIPFYIGIKSGTIQTEPDFVNQDFKTKRMTLRQLVLKGIAMPNDYEKEREYMARQYARELIKNCQNGSYDIALWALPAKSDEACLYCLSIGKTTERETCPACGAPRKDKDEY